MSQWDLSTSLNVSQNGMQNECSNVGLWDIAFQIKLKTEVLITWNHYQSCDAICKNKDVRLGQIFYLVGDILNIQLKQKHCPVMEALAWDSGEPGLIPCFAIGFLQDPGQGTFSLHASVPHQSSGQNSTGLYYRGVMKIAAVKIMMCLNRYIILQNVVAP